MADAYFATRKTAHRSLSLVYRPALPALPHQHLQHRYRRIRWSLHCVQRASTRRPVARTNKNRKNQKNEDTEPARRNPLHDLPEWSEEFTDNLVDERVPEHTDAPASSSHKSALEPLRKMVSGKHCIETHFAKDRNCDDCKKTKITRAPFEKTQRRSHNSSRKKLVI